MSLPHPGRVKFGAFSDNPELRASLSAAKSPAEKHEIIRKAGRSPVTEEELQLELAKALKPKLSGALVAPEGEEFISKVTHLATASAFENITS